MRVLVLGSGGLVGAAVVARLHAEAIEVVPFDISAGQDVLDAAAVLAAAEGCQAIVNAAGGSLRGVEPGRGTITLNVTGNWNVLAGC
jgi:nucleoside-diphosphate-sugar epimerase